MQAASHSGWDGTVSYSDTWGWGWCWETYEADGLVAVVMLVSGQIQEIAWGETDSVFEAKGSCKGLGGRCSNG